MVLMCPQHVPSELTWILLRFCSCPQVKGNMIPLVLRAAHARGDGRLLGPLWVSRDVLRVSGPRHGPPLLRLLGYALLLSDSRFGNKNSQMQA